MSKVKINIPIYDIDIILKYRPNAKKYKGAAYHKGVKNYEMRFSVITDEIIAHEIIHIKNYIFKDLGMEANAYNDEHEAYIVGYLFTTIKSHIIKLKENASKQETSTETTSIKGEEAKDQTGSNEDSGTEDIGKLVIEGEDKISRETNRETK